MTRYRWTLVLLGALLLAGTPAWADITSNLVLYLRLNEGSGTALTDSGSGAHTATTANPSWLAGANCKEDDCIGFNGTSTEIIVLDATDLTPVSAPQVDSPFSLTLWLYMTTIAGDILVAEKGSPGGCGQQEWTFWISGSTLYAQLYESNVVDVIGRSVPLTTGAHQGQWLHIALTYSGSETPAGIKIYVNGTQADTGDASSSPPTLYTGMTNTTCRMTLGMHDSNAWRLSGRMDDIKFFTRELTASDVTEDLNSLTAVPKRRLLVY